MRYAVRITETFAKTVIVEAKSFEHAVDRVSDHYNLEGSCIDIDDLDEVEFIPSSTFGVDPITNLKDLKYYDFLFEEDDAAYRKECNFSKEPASDIADKNGPLSERLRLIDAIMDDAKFCQEEFDLIRDYCKEKRFLLSQEDLDTISKRGLSDWVNDWKSDWESDLREEAV